MTKRGIRRWAFLLLGAALVIALDQITKWWVLDNLALNESRQPIPALSPFFQITRSYNTGSAFGFLPQWGDLFLLIAVVAAGAIFYLYPRIPNGAWLMRVAAVLIVGGALGNALDRLQHGLVIDFIHYQIPGVVSNVSNLADHAIVLGVGLVLMDSWRGERRSKSTAPALQESALPDEASDQQPALEGETAEQD